MNILEKLLLALLCYTLTSVPVYSGEYNILNYGAVSDTSKLSTITIQKAIDACAGGGGGQVTIPAGRFKTGSIFLKSNVSLFLEAGAILYGSRNIKDYKSIKPAFISLRTQDSTVQLIYAENCTNVSICGYGEIDGQGAAFMAQSKDEGISRPFILRFIRCCDVRVENISLKNSPCWMQHYLACERVTIHGLHIFNRVNLNNDAMDIDGCKDVTISDIISDTEDDGITLKSTSGWISENIAITNCVISSRWNAIKMGTETNGGFKNISLSNCVIKATTVFPWHDGITSGPLTAIALMITDGGILQNVNISNITIDNSKSPIYIRLGYRARLYLKGMPVTNVGHVSDISISDIRITNAGKNGCSITGIPDYPIENIRLSNIVVHFNGEGSRQDAERNVDEDPTDYPQADIWNPLPAYGFFIRHTNNITFNGMEFYTEKEDFRPAFFLDDVHNACLMNIQLQSTDKNEANIRLRQSKDIIIKGNSNLGASNCFVKAEGDKSDRIALLSNVLRNVKEIFLTGTECKGRIKESGNIR